MLRLPLIPRRIAPFFVAVSVGTVIGIIGCGGSGTGASATLPAGPEAVQAAAIGTYQSEAAGIAYPFKALALAAPTGSPLATPSVKLGGGKTTLDNGLTFEPYLNLYTGPATIANNQITETYYSDAAGSQPAGTMTLAIPAAVSNYTFPAVITAKVNLTAGNLPCNGAITITYADNTGSNTMKGTLNLLKNNETFTVDMGLDDNMNVTGSIVIQEQGATITASNLSGVVTGTLSCNIAIAPYGWTGTGTLNLTTGAYTLNVSAGSTGNCTAMVDSSGNLVITYGNGKVETLANPLTVSLLTGGYSTASSTTGSTTTTGTTGTTGSTGLTGSTGSTPTYNAPILIGSDSTITLYSGCLSNSNLVVGYVAGAPGYWMQGMSAPAPLKRTSNYASTYISANSQGQIVAGLEGNGYAYWSSPTSAEQDSAYELDNPYITDTGMVIGNHLSVSSGATGLSFAAAPLGPLSFYQFPSGVTDAYIRGFSSGGAIIADAYQSNGNNGGDFPGPPIYWSSNMVNGNVIQNPGSSAFGGKEVNDKGQFVAGTVSTYYFYKSVSATPVAVPLVFVNCLGNNGAVGGEAVVGAAGHAALWTAAGGTQDVNNLFPASANVVMNQVLAINNSGVMVVQSSTSSGGINYYLLTPKS